MKKIFTVLIILSAIICSALQAAAVTCPDIADVYIDQCLDCSPVGLNTNYNDKTRLMISYHSTHGIARGLLKFDIPSCITASQIQSATLYLSSSGHTGGGNAINVSIHALNSPFNENTETWNTHSGGDYDSSVASSGALPAGNDWKTNINVTTLLVGNLHKARTNGLLIKLTTEGPTKLYQHIASRECDDTSNPNYVAADEPPRLEISLKTDADSDGDGVNNSQDNCPNKCNSQQHDTDYDGIGDVCDPTPGCASPPNCGGCGTPQCCEVECSLPDADSDGTPDCADNCPAICNIEQLDADKDGIGDVCDTSPGCGGCGQPQCEQSC